MNARTTLRIPKECVHSVLVAGLFLAVLAGRAQPGWCVSPVGSSNTPHMAVHEHATPALPPSGGHMRTAQHEAPPPDYQNLSPKQKKRFQRNMQEWESLPPQEQQILRHRMERWRRLSPEERSLYRKRYNQYQRLPQEERRSLQEKLQNPHALSPRQREELREQLNRR